jgi:protease secretion system membrane fusion protein
MNRDHPMKTLFLLSGVVRGPAFGPEGPAGAGSPQAPAQAPAGERTRTPMSLGRALFWGWLVLLVGGGGFFAWASIAPLDQGVTAPGQVVVTGNRKLVQHPSGGIIAEILVREGDAVQAGQTLVRMDNTLARTQLETLRAQWIVARAVEGRLSAEREGRDSVEFARDLVASATESAVAQAIALQKRLFDTRRASLRTELAAIDESIAGLQAQIRGTEASREAREEQLRLLREELRNQRELSAGGYLPRNRVSEQERLQAQLAGQIAEDAAAIARARSNIGELRVRAVGRQNEYRQQAETQLTDTQKEVNALASRIQGLQFDLRNTEVRSPASGTVVALNVFTPGGVIQAGAPLMEVVPKGEPLRVEASVPPQFIDKIRPGLDVEVLFPAFNQRVTPNIKAKVTSVSADALADQRSGTTFYRAIVEVTPEGEKQLRDKQIKAGMQAEVFIRTGERTALNYLFKPLTDRLRAAMTED